MPRQESGEPYTRISVEEAKDMIDGGNASVIDVRQLDEWSSGHVQGAIHIPVDDILSRVNELPESGDLLFICAAGVRSGLACEYVASMGYDQKLLFNIEQGTPTWIEADYPTTYE